MFRSGLILLLTLASTSALAETPRERGEYLVTAVMACDGCHTPRGPAGFDVAKRFSGGSQTWDTPAYTVKGSNITPDRDTGIGAWSEHDLKRSLTDGVRPNGVPLAAVRSSSQCAWSDAEIKKARWSRKDAFTVA